MTSPDLSGRVGIVTGAGSGIGRAIAIHLADHGARIFCIDVVEETAQLTAHAISQAGHMGEALVADVARSDDCERLAREVATRCHCVDVLVNNAAIIRRGLISDSSAVDDWKATMNVDLNAPFYMIRAFLTLLSKKRSG